MKKRKINRICISCGSSLGLNPEYVRAAKASGQALGHNNIEGQKYGKTYFSNSSGSGYLIQNQPGYFNKCDWHIALPFY
jgi:hypothetical protein